MLNRMAMALLKKLTVSVTGWIPRAGAAQCENRLAGQA
jgi:hypothetical protein